MANSPKETLKDILLNPGQSRTDVTLSETIRDVAKIVVLTQAEYDGLGTPDEDTIYITVG